MLKSAEILLQSMNLSLSSVFDSDGSVSHFNLPDIQDLVPTELLGCSVTVVV